MVSGMPLKNLFSLTEPFGPPSPDAPLSETRTMTVLSSSTARLEVVEQAPELMVGVAEKTGVDLRHPREQPLLIVRERCPGPHAVVRRPGLAIVAGGFGVRVDR